MKRGIVWGFLGSIFTIAPVATLCWSIWYATRNYDAFGFVTCILASITGIIIFTPIGILMLKTGKSGKDGEG